jgi:hypothetical protein
MLRLFAIAVSLAVLTTSAIADEYWVVPDQSGQKKCSIIEKKPQSGEASTTPAGAMGPYQTREQAEAVNQRELICGGSSE